MINRREFCSALAGVSLLAHPIFPRRRSDLFLARTYRNGRGAAMPYRLFVPESYDKRESYPLVLWLHGGAGRGQDNLKQIAGGNTSGSHVWTRRENQNRHPCFVLAPQCPLNEQWATDDAVKPTGQLRLALEVIADLQKAYNLDAQRMYVTGQSLGGFGTWAVITEYPSMFAAAIPLCGGGDVSQASKLARLPIWAFHGERDEAVSVERSRSMIAAIRKAGGAPKYTEYKGAGHVIWNTVFNEPDLLPWVSEYVSSSSPSKNAFRDSVSIDLKASRPDELQEPRHVLVDDKESRKAPYTRLRVEMTSRAEPRLVRRSSRRMTF